MKNFILVALVSVIVTTVACSSGSTASPVTTAPTTNTFTVTGVVPAAMNGVTQSDPTLHSFNVGQSGTVTLTLTSAVETFPNGTLIAGVVMGLAVGSPTGGTCAVSAGVTPQLVQAGATGISGTLNAGTYCVQVSDVTVQQGPVAYTLVIVAP